MVRHEDVAEDLEEVFLAGFFEDSLEGVTGFRGFEDVAVAVATDRDEVEVTGVLVTIEALWHGMSLPVGFVVRKEKGNPPFVMKPQRMGHPLFIAKFVVAQKATHPL